MSRSALSSVVRGCLSRGWCHIIGPPFLTSALLLLHDWVIPFDSQIISFLESIPVSATCECAGLECSSATPPSFNALFLYSWGWLLRTFYTAIALGTCTCAPRESCFISEFSCPIHTVINSVSYRPF